MCVRLFLEQGYKNTSVSQVVDEADVARGSYLNLFPNVWRSALCRLWHLPKGWWFDIESPNHDRQIDLFRLNLLSSPACPLLEEVTIADN